MPQETVRFWRDRALNNMEVLKATYVTHAFSRHSHEGYAIGAIEAGVERFEYRGSVYQAPAGSLVIIHPGEVHTGSAGAQEGWQYRMTYPAVSLMQQAAGELSQTSTAVPFFQTPVISDPVMVRQFIGLHQALEQETTCLERESRMLWFLAHLIARHGEWRSPLPDPSPDQRITDYLKAYLQDHYAQPLTLPDLAHTVDLTPLRLLRLCTKAWGLSPHRYLVQIRVQQAKHLIAQGLSLADVATATGFADQSHLNRHFKRLMGITPGQYQKGCQ